MFNQQLSKIFSDIALYLEMDNVPFKPQAYEKAALVLEGLNEDAAEIYKKAGIKGIEAIPGVGASMAEKIEEYLKAGKIKYYEQLKKKMPVNIEELTAVEGIGPKMVKLFYQKLKIKNLADLEKAAKAGKIRDLPRFGLKTEQNILQWLEFFKKSKNEILSDEAEAIKGAPPNLIVLGDIRGDLHCHSNWDGGANSIEEMAKAAQVMGYQYIGIADHTKFLRIENGLDEKQLAEQRKEIDKINTRLRQGYGGRRKFHILQGCEANIMPDGSIDINDDALAKLDYVIAGVHSQMKMPKEQMTERIIKAIKNPHVNIISHPTGRLLGKRDEYAHDFDKILRATKEYNVALEINGSPWRLDLKDSNIHRAKTAGVKMVINTDSHHKEHLKFMEYGLGQARRGWAEKSDIINARPLSGLLKFFH